MASQVVTLALDGTPTIDDYAKALNGLRDLLTGLAAEVASGTAISWVVDGLDAGSAISAFRGEAEDLVAVARVADAYLEVGSTLALGDRDAQRRWSSRTGKASRQLVGILNGRVPSMRFETADNDVTVTAGPRLAALPPPRLDIPRAYGAVEGRIQTLSSRSALRFTLFDLVDDRAVSCYLRPEQQDLIRELWDRLAVVEGRIRRDPLTGRPTAVREIRRISAIPIGDEDSWRSARGVVHSPDPAEDIVRAIRDAE